MKLISQAVKAWQWLTVVDGQLLLLAMDIRLHVEPWSTQNYAPCGTCTVCLSDLRYIGSHNSVSVLVVDLFLQLGIPSDQCFRYCFSWAQVYLKSSCHTGRCSHNGNRKLGCSTEDKNAPIFVFPLWCLSEYSFISSRRRPRSMLYSVKMTAC